MTLTFPKSPPQPPPNRDKTCTSCHTPSATLYPRDPTDTDYVTGEIVVMHESVHAPIDQIFASNNLGLKAAPVPSITSRRTKSTTRGKLRPAVVLDDDSDDVAPDANTTIRAACLMASFGGIVRYEHLPDILKHHFGLPVSPHCEITEGVAHLHTGPEWQKDHMWLIASPFKSSGQVLGRWQWQDVDKGGEPRTDRSFLVEDGELIKLKAVCEERMKEWMNRCVSDEQHIVRCKEQYDVFRRSPHQWVSYLETQQQRMEQEDNSHESGYLESDMNGLKVADKPSEPSLEDATADKDCCAASAEIKFQLDQDRKQGVSESEGGTWRCPANTRSLLTAQRQGSGPTSGSTTSLDRRAS
ncbi:hypothetical protein L226DRAFT_494839 [Lentinus tigrinus ALCF2SS1-7]|uniref:uncharacterized protein n=1 Tax=Lentinus tigrinus ALCF2SS1-7 TaxID=1328758 RepID=UPI0011662563|nr:hypothetical protein L226DRAFT_494839 [Lentinus tigrinus ALCF2SS1-7]